MSKETAAEMNKGSLCTSLPTSYKEDTKIRKLFGAFLDSLVQKDRGGIAC